MLHQHITAKQFNLLALSSFSEEALEPCSLESRDNFFASDSQARSHEAIRTLWTPMNSSSSAGCPCSSRQRAITSRLTAILPPPTSRQDLPSSLRNAGKNCMDSFLCYGKANIAARLQRQKDRVFLPLCPCVICKARSGGIMCIPPLLRRVPQNS